jgi:hypothetical protein
MTIFFNDQATLVVQLVSYWPLVPGANTTRKRGRKKWELMKL